MHRFMIPYLSADDIINDARRRQNELFAEMLRREDALPLPPEPESVPLPERVRGGAARVLARIGRRPEGAGA